MHMKLWTLISCLLFAGLISAQSVEGIWKTIDESGEALSHVEICKKDGKLHGKIVKLLTSPEDELCTECPGDKKNEPLLGMEILWDLEDQGDEYDDGEIMDPKNGKVYSCKIWLEAENELIVRGYLGFSMLGRSQTWYRVR